MSEAPADVAAYSSRDLWADDIAAVIAQRGLQKPVIVAWSYGGYVVSNYLAKHGDGGVAGVNYAGWSVVVGEPVPHFVGRGFHDFHLGSISEDMPTEIAAMRGFVHACLGGEISRDDLETIIAFNVMTPRFTSLALTLRQAIDFTPTIEALDVPILASYGTADTIALPIAGEHIARVCKLASYSQYPGAGHALFVEQPDRFNRELAAFARMAHADKRARG